MECCEYSPWDHIHNSSFSSLDLAMFVQAMNCIHFVKQPSLNMKIRPKQLLGYLPFAFKLPGETLSPPF